MPKLERIWGLVCKETYQIVRDPSSIVIAFILPTLLIFLFGYAVSLDIQNLKIGIVIEDTTPDVNLLVESFNNSIYFDIKTAHDRHKVEELIVADKLRGIVVVPEQFAQNLNAAHSSAQIQVIADGSEANTAALLQNYVQGVWANWLQQNKVQQGADFLLPITTAARIWYNPEANSRFFLLPGSIAIIMTLIGT
jgi:ABC-2 type transport system permease protein